MPFYHQLGTLPRKRHTVFRQENGELYREHVVGSQGFSGPESILYHVHPPTRVLRTATVHSAAIEADSNETLRMRHFRLKELPEASSATLDRTALLFNADVALSMVRPTKIDEFFYRNAEADEIVFVAEGEGVLESQMGELPYRQGDYVVIPCGILHRFRLAGRTRLLVIESAGLVRTPKRYRNEFGQLQEHSPYCERDIRRPETLPVVDQSGEFRLLVKRHGVLTEVVLDHHPLDVVGWDGYYYPWALSIHDFEPITGSLHQPPPVHQTFQGDGFVVCSFVPRLFDYHPQAVPAPYAHSNVNSDEVLFYANDEFMSRKGIGYGSLTLHPGGLPHGPHPGRAEASIGKERTNELAVMLDTFRPLKVARDVLDLEDPGYERSWLE
jgi:homogentisate 1,2-dioxygenase